MRKLVLLCFFLIALRLQGQTLMNRDSLLQLLPQMKEDSSGIELLINLGQQYEISDLEVAGSYYRRAGALSRKIGSTFWEVKYIANYTFVLNQQGKYDSSIWLNLQAVELSRQLGDSLLYAKSLFNTGTSYNFSGQFENAARYYDQGKRLLEKYGSEGMVAQANSILQTLHESMHNYTKAIEYGEQAVSVLRKIGDQRVLCRAMNSLGVNYISIGALNKAEPLFVEALEMTKKIGDKDLQLSIYLNLGDIATQRGEFEKGKSYFEQVNILSKEVGRVEGEVAALRNMAVYHLYKKNFGRAEELGKQALALVNQHKFNREREIVLRTLANIAFARNNILQGMNYTQQADILADSMVNESIQGMTQELEVRYETEKKENQIKQLETETELQELTILQKNTLNYILVGGTVVMLIIFLLSYRTYQQKQKLQQQRISELEIERQLITTEAVLKGEEQERTRLAKDLHDGLGGMLSGIKYAMNSMKGNLIMTPDNAQAFERSMDMLDSSIREMRRVAHNMMPEALVKFGLDTALRDYCHDINQSGALRVNYQSIGLENSSIDQTSAITIYRVIQELVTNAVKHAAAGSAIVQVSKTENTLTVTVEDDGKGFDIGILRQSTGIGWSNIQNRIDFLKGKLDVNSQPGKGTSVLIELKV